MAELKSDVHNPFQIYYLSFSVGEKVMDTERVIREHYYAGKICKKKIESPWYNECVDQAEK